MMSDDIKHIIRKIEGIVEVFLLSLMYYYMWKSYYRTTYTFPLFGKGKIVLLGIYLLIGLIIFSFCESFQFGHLKLVDVVISQWISVLIMNFIAYIQLSLMSNAMITLWPVLVLTVSDFVVTLGLCYLFTAFYHKYNMPRKMVLVYENENAISLKNKMNSRGDKYLIATSVKSSEGLEAIKSKIQGHDAVVINDVPSEIRNDVLKYCYSQGIRTYEVPKISDVITRGAEEITLFDTPLLLIKGNGLSIEQRAVKRLLDIILSIIVMIPGSIIMLIVAIAIKIEDGGPVFYKQTRVTRGGRTFDILKFRSMIVDAEKEGHSIPAISGDPRITRVGKIIRPSRLDELPQMINILKGEMSFVGPRPERVEHVIKYTEEIPEFEFRNKVKGGLTGYAQIYGKYNTSAYDKLRLDLAYIENYSLVLDIRLILMTLQIIFKKESTEGFDQVKNEKM